LDRKEAEVYHRLDPARLPRHIGHHHGRQRPLGATPAFARVAGTGRGWSVRSTVETAARIGIPSLTLYAFFRKENWKKTSRSEVDFLMGCCAAF